MSIGRVKLGQGREYFPGELYGRIQTGDEQLSFVNRKSCRFCTILHRGLTVNFGSSELRKQRPLTGRLYNGFRLFCEMGLSGQHTYQLYRVPEGQHPQFNNSIFLLIHNRFYEIHIPCIGFCI